MEKYSSDTIDRCFKVNKSLLDHIFLLELVIKHHFDMLISISFDSGEVTRISPEGSDYSWTALAVNGNNVLSGRNSKCKQAVYLCITL